MNRYATVPAVLLAVALMASGPAAVATAEPRMSVIYKAPRISIEASDVTVAEVLREVGRKAGVSIMGGQSSDARLSFSIRDVSLPEALRQLLRSEDHVLLYRKGTRTIDAVVLLGTRVARAPAPVDQRDRVSGQSASQNHGRASAPGELAPTPASAPPGEPPSSQADLAGYRRLAETSPEAANATDLLLRQAWSGVPASPLKPTPIGASVSTSSTISTDERAADQSSALAIATRLAQQNLTKLVEGMSAANASLQSPARR